MKHIYFLFLLFTSFALNAEKVALVAGGAGFIGSHMCDNLIEDHYRVICLDNLQTGSLKNIEHLLKNPNFSYIEADIINLPTFEQKIDEIYNFACAASPPKYQKDPIHTLKTNFLGVMNLLNLAREKGATFLQSSTSEVYGNPKEHPQNESYFGNVNTMGPRSCYDEGKRIAEALCYEYHKLYNVSVKVARIFNTYGPRMSATDGRVVTNFITQALSQKDITIYGNGLQTRSFCYITDLVAGFRKFMKTSNEVIGPINIGNPSEVTVKEFAKLITSKIDSKSDVIYFDLPQDDPLMRKPDISKASQILNWKPKVGIEEGLSKTIEYFEKH